jgi:alpha-D-xyloside xylohydrolase
MSTTAQTVENILAADGLYIRKLLDVTAIPGGVRVALALISYKNIGDKLRPIIIGDELLAQQMLATSVPNQPGDVPFRIVAPTFAPLEVTLEIQVYSSRLVRLRMGQLAQFSEPRDFTMLVPGVLKDRPQETLPTLQQGPDEVIAHIDGVTIRLGRDPFVLSISSTIVPATVLATANDDRDVHGLLCTPPPGITWDASERETQQMFWSWKLDPDEHLYGLGERFSSFDHRGKNILLWTLDAWGTTTDAAYKNVPFLLSSHNYALFFHTPAQVSLRLGATSARSAMVCVSETLLDVFAIFGTTPKEILGEYTYLSGRATMPPRWVFGVWLSRCRYQSRAEVEAVAERARAEAVPCDVLHVDPAWLELPGLSCDFIANEQAFPDLVGMIRELRARGFKLSLWELPYVSSRSRRYAEAAHAGYFLRDAHGEPICADFGTPPADGHIRAVLDFTNPAARRWWQDLHRPWLRAGVEVFKTDFGEGVPRDARAFNGMSGQELHNLFPLLYNAAVHEVIAQETRRPGMIWGRSGWAGIQRYPAQWGGDPKTDSWSMRSSLRGGLSMALSAPGIWAHDIGGFYGPEPSPALYSRWSQFGLLSPLARAHGTTPREPWHFGEEALAIFKRYAMLRMRLNPYLYAMAWEAHSQGLPMLRPFALEFPQDPQAWLVDDSYMLGTNLLVAPIFSEAREPVERPLYLPGGTWYDFWNDERIEGGRFITRTVPLDTIPLYVRAGAIIPLGPEHQFIADDGLATPITLEIYAGAAGEAQIIWDDTGFASHLQLSRRDNHWQLAIAGEYVTSWHIRWHSVGRVVEYVVEDTASALVTLA